MKGEKEVGMSKKDFRGRLNGGVKERIKNGLLKERNGVVYNLDRVV